VFRSKQSCNISALKELNTEADELKETARSSLKTAGLVDWSTHEAANPTVTLSKAGLRRRRWDLVLLRILVVLETHLAAITESLLLSKEI
jgi:hypothetical protein